MHLIVKTSGGTNTNVMEPEGISYQVILLLNGCFYIFPVLKTVAAEALASEQGRCLYRVCTRFVQGTRQAGPKNAAGNLQVPGFTVIGLF